MNNNEFMIVKSSSKTDVIVENLISLIRERKLKPSDRLPPERELAELMQVSRPSLREALKALEVMNLIEIRQGAGAFVRRLDPESIVEHLEFVFNMDETLLQDLYQARKMLESTIARLAAQNITDEELRALEANANAAANAVDRPEEFLRLDVEMHEMILKAAGNRVMAVFAQSIANLSRMMREKTNSSLRIRKNTILDHGKIVLALKLRDPELTGQAMEEHLSHVETYFNSGFFDDGEEEQD